MSLRRAVTALKEHPLRWAIPVSVVISLAGTGDIIFREDVRELYETNGDILSILRHAERASARDVLRWWTGVWIEHDSPYYRPLASMLFYGEHLAFGSQWRPFCIVTWLMHAGICVLILLLLARLWDHRPPAFRVLPGLLAVAWFSIPCDTSVGEDHWGNRGIARGVMPYWPAQTDVGCLLLSLVSLLLFDGWLTTGRRGRLIGAIGAFIAALLFKEHAVIVPLLAAMIAIHRGRSIRFVSAAGALGLVGSGLFLIVRSLLAPEAWGPGARSVGEIALKFAFYLWDAGGWALYAGDTWVVVSAVLVAASFAFALWRPHAVWVYVAGVLIALLVPPHLMAGNIALLSVHPWEWTMLRTLSVLLVLVIAWEARRRAPTLILAACLVFVLLPILHVTGPHYFYWPVAWWSMLNATVLVALVGTLKAASERAGRSSADEPEEHPAD